MPLSLFYEASLSTQENTTFYLNAITQKHCIRVLRKKVGDTIALTNGAGTLCEAVITAVDKQKCSVVVKKVTMLPPPVRKIAIAISPIKNASRLEWFLEKACEIGVAEIIPLHCHRTEKATWRIDRLHNILVEAMLQSQQAWLPILKTPMLFNDFINSIVRPTTQRFIAHCQKSIPLNNLKTIQLKNCVQILIGPEGDFTIEEVQSAIAQNCIPVSLGKTRLRTETAGVVASTLFSHF